MSRGFIPPTRSEWSATWRSHGEAADARAYRESCWSFDPVLGDLLPHGKERDALEIGCYPGGFMRYLHARFGYRVSGLDYVPEAGALADELRRDGVDVERIYVGDVADLTPEPRYDVVASFGFIEHFDDPAAILALHTEWLAPGGWLVVEVPHFRRLQWALHRALDAHSLRGHNLDAMRPELFTTTLERLGLRIEHLGYVGFSQFWYEPDPDRGAVATAAARVAQAALTRLDRGISRTRLDLQNPITSPFLICVARRG